MDRTRRLAAKVGLVSTWCLAGWLGSSGPPASADLIRKDASQSFPDLSGDIVGTQTYVFDPATKTGTFQVRNAPSLLAVGPKASSEFDVTDEQAAGRTQTLRVKLDQSGRVLSDAGNSFSVRGQVVLAGKTYSGLLLEGTPTQFGWAARSPNAQAAGTSVFDVNVKLTGGKLLEIYGPEAYLRVTTDADGTFQGGFTRDFAGGKVLTDVRASDAPPIVVPEPSMVLVVLVVFAAGLLSRRRARAAADD